MKSRIAIIHFQPLEYYSPVCNFLSVIAANNQNWECTVFTTFSSKSKNQYSNSKIHIIRLFSFENSLNALFRLIGYYYFNVGTFIGLIFKNPSVVIYFESYSAMPAYWYIKWFGKNKKLWMHSHEYFTKDWYLNGMKTVKLYHKKETNFLYKRADGLSHTNSFRANLFLADYPWLEHKKMHIIPNYPPKNWKTFQNKLLSIEMPLKTVYIGSLSLQSTYIQKYCEWLVQQNGKVILDIYTTNADTETIAYIQNINSKYIRFYKEGIVYEKIPERILKEQYQVGLILYNGGPPNTIYCASNKLFEYLICGLDVWFSQEMLGTYPYITQHTYPKVLKVDFTNMNLFDLKTAINHEDCSYRPFNFECESVYEEFLSKLLN